MLPSLPRARLARIVVGFVAGLVVTAGAGTGCGISVQPLEAFDVSIKPTQDCTLTGATSQDCTDADVLAQQTTTGRWILEHGPSAAFSLTTEEGLTLPGIYFNDDALTFNQPPCVGAGGLCYFARHKTTSTDAKNNNCGKFTEHVAILHRIDEDNFDALVQDANGSDDQCGTPTAVQKVWTVSGKRTADPSLAREENTDAGPSP